MCLIFLSFREHKNYPLVLAANRDEFYHRPTAPLGFWEDAPHILAGRDLKDKGTWLGITRTGRFAAVTNYRDPKSIIENAVSRGFLVSRFLEQENMSPQVYLENIQMAGHQFNGFNLIVGDISGIYYYSNRGSRIHKLDKGLYGLSNSIMDTPWPKINKGKSALQNILYKDENPVENILNILEDRSYPPDDTLPDTGVGITWERILSPLFVTSDVYGTRSSSIILIDQSGKIHFTERTFIPQESQIMEYQTREFSFSTNPLPYRHF